MMIIHKTSVPFDQFSSALPDSPTRLLWSWKSTSVVFPRSRLCTQQIWNQKLIVLAILGIWITIAKLTIGMQRMYIHTRGWHTFYFITFMSVTGTWWGRWSSGWRQPSERRCRRFCWRCGSSFTPWACPRILYCAILAWQADVWLIFINHCRLSFYHSLQLLMTRKLNSSLLRLLDIGAMLLY